MKIKIHYSIMVLVILSSFFLAGCDEKVEVIEKKTKIYEYFYPAKDVEVIKFDKTQSVYLPVYSHVYTSEEKYEPLGITVSIRNTDFKMSLLVKEIGYYDTKGDLVETYISQPYLLAPMASVDFIVDLRDMRGGSGANFIIKYSYENELSTPIIQAVMVNNSINRAFSFITNGQFIK